MNEVSIHYKSISCQPLSHKHIATGWLDWINNTVTTKHLASDASFTKESLSEYLSNTQSLLFLACYSDTGTYFGNLRIYEIADGVASFGRLIGDEKHRGLGYGKLMSELANALIFDYLQYDTIIVGNTSENHASAVSKLKTGFRKLNKKELPLFLGAFEAGTDYYIKYRQAKSFVSE